MDLDSVDWQVLAEQGTAEELVRWGDEYHHIDLTDTDVVLSLAANAILEGAWRNNTELEAIHVGEHKRRGQPKSGLSDAEMMLGNIETTKVIRRHLTTDSQWWYFDLERELCDFDRPYPGGPLSSHVTKVGLKAHKRQVSKNVWMYHLIEDIVGRDRFLLGLALTGMDHAFWGSPLWPAQVDAWAEADTTDPKPTPTVIAQMKADPTNLPFEAIRHATRTAIGYARGDRKWHAERCGDPDHRPGSDLATFLGVGHHIFGAPMTWLTAFTLKAEARRGDSGSPA